MIRFIQNRLSRQSATSEALTLGNLEFELMEILWSQGSKNVRDMVRAVSRTLAYTTVMTTLDRLFKKGFLSRRKSRRAFVYSPRFSREQWERRRADHLVAGFLEGPRPAREVLLSCLLDAVGEHDPEMLDQLEKRIRARRKEILRREDT